ncbi:MAG: endonuclease III [Bacteroidales bacterium]|nr:endonuclease III [Bacteroidales bacterium]
MTKKSSLEKIIEIFEQKDPFPETELHYKSEYELIVAVILSAQCTDVRVNKITPELFKAFPTLESMAKAEVSEIFEKIKSCSYPNNKSRNLSNMARVLLNEYNGVLPTDPEEMQKLPGVGRKTANVLASVLFRKNVLAVDTHVFRVAKRLGLASNAKTPLAVEKIITSLSPPEKLHNLHHWLILHGRYVCKARKPDCANCIISHLCDFKDKNLN